MDIIFNSIFYSSDIVNSILVLPLWVFGPAPGLCSERGCFSPHCWEQTGQCLQRRWRSGMAALPADLACLVPSGRAPCAPCSRLPTLHARLATSPSPAAIVCKSSLAWRPPTQSCHHCMESDSEFGLWLRSPCLRPLCRSLLSPGRALGCAERRGAVGSCVTVPPVSLFPLAQGWGFSGCVCLHGTPAAEQRRFPMALPGKRWGLFLAASHGQQLTSG